MKKGSVSNFKGKKHSIETRNKMRDFRTGKIGPMKGKNHSIETKEKISEGLKEKLKGKQFDCKGEKNNAFGKKWDWPEDSKRRAQERMIKRLISKPKNQAPHMSKPESILFNKILKDLDFKYVGDWSLWINGKNPDFINNEKKIVVEYNSEYWHRNDTDEKISKRIELFKSAGYETFIIYEKDMNNLEEINKKLRNLM